MSTRDARITTIVVAAAVCALAASAAWWIGLPPVAALFGAGIPVGVVSAGRRATALTGAGWAWSAAFAGIEAPVLASLALTVFGIVAALPPTPPDTASVSALGMLTLAPFILVYGCAIGWPAAVPTSLLAGWLVRRAAVLGPGRARPHLVVLATAALVAGCLTAASATGVLGRVAPRLRPLGFEEERSAPVTVTLTLDNRTALDRTLTLSWSENDGEAGVEWGIGGCSHTTGSYELGGTDWWLAAVRDGESRDGAPIVTAADWPAPQVAITVRFTGTGTEVLPGADALAADWSSGLPACAAART